PVSAVSPRRTAISRAVRAIGAGHTWFRRPWRRPRPLPAVSSTCVNGSRQSEPPTVMKKPREISRGFCLGKRLRLPDFLRAYRRRPGPCPPRKPRPPPVLANLHFWPTTILLQRGLPNLSHHIPFLVTGWQLWRRGAKLGRCGPIWPFQ